MGPHSLINAYQWFRFHGSPAEQAYHYAKTEALAEERDLVVLWEDDAEEYQLGTAETERPAYVLACLVYRASDLDSHGSPVHRSRPLACLGGIGLDRRDDPYVRQCAADMLMEALLELDAEDQAEADKLAARATFAGLP